MQIIHFQVRTQNETENELKNVVCWINPVVATHKHNVMRQPFEVTPVA